MEDDEVTRASRVAGSSGLGSARPLPLSDLPQMSLTALRAEWRRLFRASPPTISRDLMIRGLAYRLQEQSLGGLTKATQRKLRALQQEFATQGEISVAAAPSIKAGSRLVREWHRRTHIVTVTEAGFEYCGQSYPSLTKIARVITGAHWSGPRFFGLVRAEAQVREPRPTSHLAAHKRLGLDEATDSGLRERHA